MQDLCKQYHTQMSEFKHKYLEKYSKIISDNGGDLNKLLKSYYNFLLRKKKLRDFRTTDTEVSLDRETYIKFRLVCLSEGIRYKKLLESFMNFFIESDSSMYEFLEKIDNYNNESIFGKEQLVNSKRKDKALLLLKKQNIDKEWMDKYTNIKINDVDF